MVRGWKNLFIGHTRGLFYFRVFGYGLWFASYSSMPAPFSERNGYVKVLRFKNWRMKVLRRWQETSVKQNQKEEASPGATVQQ